jgi:competence protein ComEA
MGWRQNLGEYFNFSRRDRLAIILIVGLMAIIFLLPTVSPSTKKTATLDTAWIAPLQKLEQKDSGSSPSPSYTYDEHNTVAHQYDRPTGYRPKGELFYFDPNTLTAAGWAKLGIREKTILTIQNYLSKGGRFRQPDDVQRIYGLFPDEFERIAPYIQIAASNDNNNIERTYTNNNTSYSPKPNSSRYAAVDINTADTTAFVALPGIGSKLASRIIGFRDKLGGFYSVAQIGETYGLPDSTFQRIKQYLQVGNGGVKKINVNTATTDELKAHPYIKWALANPIVAYRKEHGDFKKLVDIKNIMAVTEEAYNKMAPYLMID